MKIALIGASGFLGSAIRDEALARGHQVTGLVHHPDRLGAASGQTVLKSDAFDTPALAAATGRKRRRDQCLQRTRL